jgi:uncharacterized membrane protein YhaH (DUF805 family)
LFSIVWYNTLQFTGYSYTIGIAFIVTVVLFIFNALKMQRGSNRFSTSKDDSKKK